MSYTPSYPQRINFENDPSTATPLNQTNLNKMDNALYQHDMALSAQDERISDLEGEDKVTSFKGRTGVVTPADDDYTIAQIKATGSEGQIPALNAQGKLAMVTPNKAGHDIVDKVGNVMTTRDNLQFVGAVSVTDDSTNNKTIVNVTGGGGGGGGHTIEDTNATTMPQEENLQFVGVYTEDDATNDRTKVNIVREMTSAQMQSLTTAQKKGFIHTTDEPDNPYAKSVVSMQILWENPNPNVAFPAQNITLSSDDYDMSLIIYGLVIGGLYEKSVVCRKNAGALLDCAYEDASTTPAKSSNFIRTTSSYSPTVIHISDARIAYTQEITNTLCIPICIYGIKFL